MKGDIIRQTYEIKCIAPVHIDSGEELRTFEYLYNRDKLELCLLNESKWLAFLETRGLTEAFIKYVEIDGAGRSPRNLLEWLTANRVTEADLRKAGVIRRKVPVAQLSEKKYKNRKYWQEICSVRGSLKEKGHKWNEIILRLEQELLHTLTYEDTEHGDAVASALRGLCVSDAMLVGCAAKAPTIIAQKIDATTLIKPGERRGESPIVLFRECIPADSRLRFTITANLPMLRAAGIDSLPSVLNMLRTCTLDGLTRQQRVFEAIDAKYYGALFDDITAFKANALLGGGTGFLTKSLIYALADKENDARRFAAAYFDEQFTNPSHKHMETDVRLTPRTLKRAQTDGADWIMGLCSITGVGNAQTL